MRLTRTIQWRPRLGTILLLVNLTVLILPIGSIYFFRFYENELVRQTESELIAQGSTIIALYKKLLRPHIETITEYGHQATSAFPNAHPYYQPEDTYYQPIPALLDLASAHILPPRAKPEASRERADFPAAKVGSHMTDLLRETSRTTLAGIRIVDYNAIVVASSSNELGLSYANNPKVLEALEGSYVGVIRKRITDEPYPALASISRGTGIRVFVNIPIMIDNRVVGAVLLSRSPKNILKALHDRKDAVLWMVSILFATVLLLTWVTSYTINRPIHTLIAKARRITKGEKNIDLKLNKRITQEVAMLSDSIATMAKTIESRSEYIKDFATAVSHEFKTPLTSIGGTVELLQEHIDEMDIKKRERFLSMMAQDTKRLRKLVERLLELAKADISEATGQVAVIREVLLPLKRRYGSLGLTVRFDKNNDHAVRMAPEILESICVNLFDNSIQHGAQEVKVTIRDCEERVRMVVQDDGDGISDSNYDKIFTAFFTTNRENGGTGLGLGIVKSLLHTHDGVIELLPSEAGAQFSISLPIA